MSLVARRRKIQDAIATSSMADIAFLLLIFFLVTTVFPKDRGLSLILPQGETPVPAENVLHFLVGESETVEVRRGASPLTQRIRAADVAAVWTAAVAGNPRLIAAVSTAPDAAYGRMVDVLDQLSAAGAERVSLRAEPR